MKRVNLVPYVCGAGATKPGGQNAALELERRGMPFPWVESPAEQAKTFNDLGIYDNLPPRGSAERNAIVLRHGKHLAAQVESIIARGLFPITMGGDHSMAAASVSALARAKNAVGKTGLIWIDAHPDLNTPATSPSQSFHGMGVMTLLGQGHPDFVALTGGEAILKPENILYLGLRDIDAGEREAIDRLGIAHYTVGDTRKEDLQTIMDREVARISNNVDALAMSIDLDSFDPTVAPSVGSPVPGGFTADEVLPVLKNITAKYDFDLFEIAEFNPAFAGVDQTYNLIKEILSAVTAKF